jgi:hypothetical protein
MIFIFDYSYDMLHSDRCCFKLASHAELIVTCFVVYMPWQRLSNLL